MLWKDIVYRLRGLFFRRQAEQDLQDELQFHLEMQRQKYGDSAEAERQARVKFGSIDRAAVSRRMKELGIRMALGAKRKELLKAAIGRPLKLLVIGSVAGLVLGILASRVLALIVYQASPRDPLVLAGVVLAMLLLGLFATWIPARRALSIDPLVLLREE